MEYDQFLNRVRDNNHHIQCICDLCTPNPDMFIGTVSCTCILCDPTQKEILKYARYLIANYPSYDTIIQKSNKVEDSKDDHVEHTRETKTHMIKVIKDEDDLYSVEVVDKTTMFTVETIFVLDIDEAMDEVAECGIKYP